MSQFIWISVLVLEMPFAKFDELFRGLDEEAGLGLDGEDDVVLARCGEDAIEAIGESLGCGLAAKRCADQWAAGLEADRFRAEFRGHIDDTRSCGGCVFRAVIRPVSIQVG